MVDQLVAEKVPSCGINWQLGTLIIGPIPGQPKGQFRWYKSLGPGLKIGAKPRGLPEAECSRLELIDALNWTDLIWFYLLD